MSSAAATTHHHEHLGPFAPSGQKYERLEPERSVLHEAVRGHLSDALAQAAEISDHGVSYPGFVETTFHRYLECGLLGYGFVRVHCDDCGCDRLVAFSCKARGLCPSCSTRRMHDTTAHLIDRVLPHAPYRPWVVSFPRYLRFQLARDPSLITELLRGFLQVIFAWQRRRARARGIIGPSLLGCGAITFVQRFGGFVNLSGHFHAVLPDGVLMMDESGVPRFRRLDPPSDGDIAALAGKVICRIAKLLARRDQDRDGDHAGDPLAYVQAASVRATCSAPGAISDAGSSVRHRVRSAFIAGRSLHANVASVESPLVARPSPPRLTS